MQDELDKVRAELSASRDFLDGLNQDMGLLHLKYQQEQLIAVAAAKREALEEAYSKHVKELSVNFEKYLRENELLKEEKTSIETELDNSQNEIEMLRATIRDKDSLITSHGSNAASHNDSIEELRTENARLLQILETRSNEFMEAKAAGEDLREMLFKTTAELVVAEKEISQLKERCDS